MIKIIKKIENKKNYKIILLKKEESKILYDYIKKITEENDRLIKEINFLIIDKEIKEL